MKSSLTTRNRFREWRSLKADTDFIVTPEGRELYFHRNSVLGRNFEQLKVETEVRFDEEMSAQGSQATTVKVVNSSQSPRKL